MGTGNSLVMNNEQHVYALRFDCDEGEDALTGVAFYIFSFIKTRQLMRAERAARGWTGVYHGSCIDSTHQSHTLDLTLDAPRA